MTVRIRADQIKQYETLILMVAEYSFVAASAGVDWETLQSRLKERMDVFPKENYNRRLN